MRIIIELDNGQPEPQVQVNNNTGSDQATVNAVAPTGAAINAGSPKINSDNSSAISDMQNMGDTALPSGSHGATTSAGEAPVH